MVSAANEQFGTRRTSVTGAMLHRYMDKDVRLIGEVVKSGPIDTLELNTGDGAIVTVKLPQPLDEPVEGLVDVQGKVINRSCVNGNFTSLPAEQAAAFDLKTYSEAVTLTANFENPWTVSDS